MVAIPNNKDALLLHLFQKIGELANNDHCFCHKELKGLQTEIDQYISQNFDVKHDRNEFVIEHSSINQSFFDAVSDMVLVLDEKLRIKWLNQAAAKALNVSLSNVLGKECHSLFDDRFDFCKKCPYLESLSKHSKPTLRSNLNKCQFYDIQAFPDYNTNGDIIGIVEIIKPVKALAEIHKDLKTSQTQQKAIFNNSTDAIVYIEPDSGLIIDANSSFIKLFGIKDFDDLKELNVWDLYPDYQQCGSLSKSKGMLNFAKAMNEVTLDYEWLHQRISGEQFFTHVSLIRINYGTKKILQATIRDISKTKQAELKLLESLERYKALLQATPDLMFVYDKDGKFLDFHASVEEKLLLPPGFFLHKYVDEVLTEQLAKTTQYNIDQAMLTGETREYTYSLEIEGKSREYEARMVPFGSNKAMAIVRDVTDKHQSEIALQQAHETYRGILDSISEAIYIQDQNGIILETNKTVEKWYSIQKEEIIGETPAALSAPGMNNLNDIGRKINEAFNGTPQRFEFWGIRSNGTVFPKEVVLTNGKYFGKDVVIAVGRDISERKNAEDSLRLSKNRIDSIFRVVPIGIGVVKDRLILELNPQLSVITGYEINELRNQNSIILYNSKVVYEFVGKEIVRQINDSGTGYIETQWKRKDGVLIDVQITIAPIVQTKLEQGLTFTVMDITSRKRTEEKLSHQAKLQQILMEISSTYINLPLKHVDKAIIESLSKLGEFVNADRAYIFLYDFKKQICRNTHEWCAIGVKSELENLQNVPLSSMSDCVETHLSGKTMFVSDVQQMEFSKARELLEQQNIRSLINVPMMHNNEVIGFVGFDSVKIPHLYSNIEKQILDVYAQIIVNIIMRKRTEEILINSLARAEESDKLKTAFLANISHEIRTPLNGIVGFSTLLKKQNLPKERFDYYLNIIVASTNQLTLIINDVVEISKVETGQVDIYLMPVNINSEISGIVKMLAGMAHQKQIVIETDFALDDKSSTIITDQEKLNHVVTHICNNAIKFTEKGKVKITYTIKGNMLEFSIADTGIGIEMKHHSAIFERFRQVEMDTTRRFGGTGLGLTIAKAYVEVLGGKIWVESDISKGSTFYFTLPYIKPN